MGLYFTDSIVMKMGGGEGGGEGDGRGHSLRQR